MRKGKTEKGKEQGAAEWVAKEGFMEETVSKLTPEGCKTGQGKGWWWVRETDGQQMQTPQVFRILEWTSTAG